MCFEDNDLEVEKIKMFSNKYFENYSGVGYRYEELYPVMKSIAETLVRLCSPAKVLDVGAAMGFLVKAFQNLGVECVGIDVSDYAVKKAVVRDLILMDATKMGFKSNTFDLITSLDTIEHLRNPEKFASEAYRLLKPGGFLFVVTPQPKSPDAKKDPTHISVFSEKEWLEVFKEFDRVKQKERQIIKTISDYYANKYSKATPTSLVGHILNILKLRKVGIYYNISTTIAE